MRWTVEILNASVAAEIDAWPLNVRASLLKIVERIEAVGLHSLREPHVKHLRGKIWEMRPSGGGNDGRALYVTATGSACCHRRSLPQEGAEDTAALVGTGGSTRQGREVMTIPFGDLKKKWMADPEFRAAYEAISPEMEIAFAVAEARHRAHLTQAELAERIGTSQATVARWENGAVMPSTKSLKRVAEATGTRLRVELV